MMKILIIRLSSLGDIVLTEPIIRTLAELYPQAEISYLVKPAFKDIVSAFPTQVKTLDWNNDLSSLLQLSKVKYDILIDLHNKPNTALIRSFCRATIKSVYNKAHRLRKNIVAHTTSQSISSTLDLYYSALKKINITPQSRYPQITADDSANVQLKENKLQNGNFILIFPGATSFTKKWLPEYFIELINLVSPDFQVVLAGGESESQLSAQIIQQCNDQVIDLCARTSIRQLISLINKAKVIIANDSGPAHIAAALHKPQITIFGATSPKLGFAPLNDKNVLITQNLSCSPCSLHGSDSCPLHHFNCMKTITPQIVYEELLKIL
ncbi:MAG: glycosyltransferase family 9 protein [Candidatus Stygibacter australis]|nr:glycosyltransferase family 9 protein [Candidatus Stygibacter australis]